MSRRFLTAGLALGLVVSEPSLLFAGTVVGTAPDPVTVEIADGGGGSVGGISASLHYPEGGATRWLSLALAGTSAPTTLTVSGLVGLLEEGTHEATLVLASQDDRISPVTVPVQAVVILDRPIIGLSSRALEFRADAAGAPPPLTISDWVRGEARTPVRIVLYGLQGSMQVGGAAFNGTMPAFGARLTDQELAAVLSYVRSSWGNDAPAIGPGDVKTVREAEFGRTRPFTPGDVRRARAPAARSRSVRGPQGEVDQELERKRRSP